MPSFSVTFALLYFLLLRVIKHIQLFRPGFLIYRASILRRSTTIGLLIGMFEITYPSTISAHQYHPVPFYLYRDGKNGKYPPLFNGEKHCKKSEILARKKEAKYGRSISTNIDFHQNPFCDSDSAHFFKQDC